MQNYMRECQNTDRAAYVFCTGYLISNRNYT